jgi:hypothetical protein
MTSTRPSLGVVSIHIGPLHSRSLPRPTTTLYWLATVDGTSIQILMGGRDLAVEEAIRQALLPEDQRTPAKVSKPN